MPISLPDLEHEVIRIAQHAGSLILELYNNPELWSVETKADNSPVTAADKRSNDYIVRELSELLPQAYIISEEIEPHEYRKRKDYEYCWSVDPLDGTKEFIKRNGEFSVNIALLQNGYPVLGVLFAPVDQQTYTAYKGGGARCINGTTIKRLQAATLPEDGKGCTVIASRSHLDPLTQGFIDALDAPQLITAGSALKFMRVADGTAHLYPRAISTYEWDTAATHCILEEAGGTVLTFQHPRQPLSYNREDLRNPGFIAFGILPQGFELP